MIAAQLLAFAFLVGVTLNGLAGTLMELVVRNPVSFAAPYVTRSHPLRSLLAAILAGPLMLGNDTLDAWRGRRLSAVGLVSSAMIAVVWSLTTGIAVLGVAARTLVG